MIVPKGMTCGFGNRKFKPGDTIPKELEPKFSKQIERYNKKNDLNQSETFETQKDYKKNK